RWVVNYPPEYENLLRFNHLNKWGQRKELGKFFQVPELNEDNPPFIVRPLNHFGGANYYIFNDINDAENQKHRLGGGYISSVVPKEKEFRVIFVHGKPVVFMVKANID